MKKTVNKAFEKITPIRSDSEILKTVLRKAENMETKKKLSFKKPLIAVCAGAAALSVGVFGAAAAGILNFNSIFGQYMNTKDETLGQELIGTASSVTYTSTDSDYKAELIGVTGTEDSITGMVELRRTDGKPITKDFYEDTYLNLEAYYNQKEQFMTCYNMNFIGGNAPDNETVTECDGIGIYFDLDRLENDIKIGNKPISLTFKIQDDFEQDAEVYCAFGIEFIYTPSEKSLEYIEKTDFSDIDEPLLTLTYNSDVPNYSTASLPCSISKINVNCIKSYIEGSFDYSGIDTSNGFPTYNFIGRNNHPYYLIKNNGERIKAYNCNSGFSSDGDFIIQLRYYDGECWGRGNNIAVDVSEIAAIEIEGNRIELR